MIDQWSPTNSHEMNFFPNVRRKHSILPTEKLKKGSRHYDRFVAFTDGDKYLAYEMPTNPDDLGEENIRKILGNGRSLNTWKEIGTRANVHYDTDLNPLQSTYTVWWKRVRLIDDYREINRDPENEYLITVNKQREPMAWGDASDAAGIELDRPESRQIANSRRQISFGRRRKKSGKL